MADDIFRPIEPKPRRSTSFDGDADWMELASSLEDAVGYSFPEFGAEHAPKELTPAEMHAQGIFSEEYLRQLESEAQERGYAAGEQAGLKVAQERGQQTLDALAHMMDVMRYDFDVMQQQWAKVTVDIATELTQKVLGMLTDAQQQYMLDQLIQQSGLVADGSWNLAVPAESLARIQRLMEGSDYIIQRVVADHALPKDSVSIRTKVGDVMLDPLLEIQDRAQALRAAVALLKPELGLAQHVGGDDSAGISLVADDVTKSASHDVSDEVHAPTVE